MAAEEAVDEVGVGGDHGAPLAGAVENGGAHDDDSLHLVGCEPAVVRDILHAVEVGRGVERWRHGQRRRVFGVALRRLGTVEGVVD